MGATFAVIRERKDHQGDSTPQWPRPGSGHGGYTGTVAEKSGYTLDAHNRADALRFSHQDVTLTTSRATPTVSPQSDSGEGDTLLFYGWPVNNPSAYSFVVGF